MKERGTPGNEEYLNALVAQMKPCPFCSVHSYKYSRRRITYTWNPVEYRVAFYCNSCKCRTGYSKNPAKLVKLWNMAERKNDKPL
jgi:hypothetical protein